MDETPEPDRSATNWLVDQLTTASAADLRRIADSASTWFAIVDLHFRRRFPLEHAIWRATVAADGLAAADERPAPPTWPEH